MSGYYHLSVSVISRSTGRSAVACAAYRAGDVLADHRYGKVHDYGRRGGIAESGIASPSTAPTWVANREELWNAVEAAERRKDSQLSREFVVGFPAQLDANDRRDLLQSFVTQQFTSRGLVADWAIHAPNRKGDDRNWHAHIMTTMRSVSETGFSELKDRSLNKPEQLRVWREAWANAVNGKLKAMGVRDSSGAFIRVDHRSYADRGLPLEPTQHLGVHATAMERRGLTTERGEMNREVRRRNNTQLAAESVLGDEARRKIDEAATRFRTLDDNREDRELEL